MQHRSKSFIWLLVLLLVLSSCTVKEAPPQESTATETSAASSESSAPVSTENTKEVILAAHRDLTPGEKDGYYCSLILEVWEPLVRLAADGSPEPALAESWEMSEDGKEWTLKLKKGVTFHDGEAFNADAVIANIQRLVDHSPKKSPFYTLDVAKTYPDLNKVEKIDDHTVKFMFNVPSPSAIMRLTNFGSPMVSPKCLDEKGDFKGTVQGTGPFKIVEHQADQYTRLEAFDNYYGEKAKVKQVKILTMPSAETRATALRAGEIHGVLDIGAILAAQAHEFSKDTNFVVDSRPSTITHFLQINQSKPKLNDPRLIQAMNLAIDRQVIVKELYYGHALASANPLNASEPGFIKDEPVFDLEKAKELAKEVLQGENLAVELLVPQYGINRYPYKEQAEYVQAALKEIGIDVTISIVEGSEQMKRRNEGTFDMAFHTQGMPDGDPVTMLKVFMGPGNKAGYDNQEAVQLLQQASQELDPSKRLDLYKKLQELAIKTLPTLALFHDHYLVVHHKDLLDYHATNYGVTLSKMHWANP